MMVMLEGAFRAHQRLARIAQITGERKEMCANLRRCLALAPAMQRANPLRWHNIDREIKDTMREAGCTDEEATFSSVDPDLKPAS